MARRLYRSQTEKMIGGVCGGLAEVLDIDPTIVRVVFVLLGLLGGHGVLLYIILWLIMPRQDQIKPESK
jgi:phage shock protein C